MKLGAALLVTIISLVGTSCRREPSTSAEPGTLAHPLFWAATKDGKTTYLLGTMHVGVDAAALPPVVLDKLDAARTFAMETDLGDAELIAAMQRPTGTLHDELGPVYWHKLEGLLTPDQARAIDGMKPMVAASLLSTRGLPPTPPMDRTLRDRARGHRTALVYLETAAEQLAILDKHLNAKALKIMLDDPARDLDSSHRMLAAYIAGDEAAIEAETEVERIDALARGYTAAEYTAVSEDLLDHRNAAWIPGIEKLHAAGGGFVAVGAMHLIGKGSVRDRLERAGYRITRVSP